MQERVRLVVLNPTEQPKEGAPLLAQRLPALDGKVIGYLWNSKPHGDRVLKLLAERLSERHGTKAIHAQKVIIGSRAPQELLEDMISKCDAVISALAD